ncbi:serine-rich protein-like protein [Rhynchospora pubera]|uniref:Serine-rich protein-like protein n=1 Tax=Rhynchospora pubera TaxID=906938 RepID=A0AAV8HKM5_9POAL|nr:serine-rich protein-like protein [Rhynchospora pubera]KAJ4816405.1 serine-rich protein-like protein [Rhynchospora pubera]
MARRSSGPVLRSLSPSGRFSSTSTSFLPSQSTYTTKPSPILFNRSASPTRINLGSPTSSPSVRFALANHHGASSSSTTVPRRTCMCAPTTHPGSFRCKLHKGMQNPNPSSGRSNSAVSSRLNARRSAMTNSLVRIGSVEGGEWVKRALAALIRPSSHHQRRRTDFQRRPSRLSAMAVA